MAISAKPSRTRMVTDPAAHLCRQGLDVCQSPARTSCNRQRGGYGWLRILAKPTHGHAAKQDTCTGDVTISGPLVWFFSVRMLAASNLGPASCPRGARNGQDMRGQGRQLRDGSPRRKAFSGRPGKQQQPSGRPGQNGRDDGYSGRCLLGTRYITAWRRLGKR